MNLARVRVIDAFVGAWGVALLVFLSLDWYTLPQGGVSGWNAFSVLDKLLALLALLAILTPVVTAARERPAWPVAMNVICTALAFVIAFFFLYRLFDQPGPDGDVAVDAGAWLGGFALLGIFLGSYRAQADERAPAIAQADEIPVMPAPPRETGSSPTAGA